VLHLPRFHSLNDFSTAPNAVITCFSCSCYPALTSGQQTERVPWQEFPSPSFLSVGQIWKIHADLTVPREFNGLRCKSTTAAAQQQRHPRRSMARSSGRRKAATASGGGSSSSNSSSTRKDAAEAAPRKMRLRRRPALADISAAVGNNQGSGAAAGAGAGSKPGARKTVRCQACCWVGCNTLARHRIALGHGKAAAREARLKRCKVPPSEVSEHDVVDRDDPIACAEYAMDMYKRYKELEEKYTPTVYMHTQVDINCKMRAILIDWIVEVHLKFKLADPTLYLTCHIIDRFCMQENVHRSKLQLVGVTALLIACKYEEIFPTEVRDCVYITDHAYTREEVLEMEQTILRR
ncbi:unnamed protein product, partial [Ectocarpus sp. 8 AP-2014]